MPYRVLVIDPTRRFTAAKFTPIIYARDLETGCDMLTKGRWNQVWIGFEVRNIANWISQQRPDIGMIFIQCDTDFEYARTMLDGTYRVRKGDSAFLQV